MGFHKVSLGQVLPWWKTQPIAEGAASPAVHAGLTVLTGQSFADFAFNASRDVFVLFHAPWCSVCSETVLPLLSQLADRIQEQGWDADAVKIAKLDASLNECEEEAVEFPKIVLYPAVEAHQKMKERRIYPGFFNLEHLTEYLVKYSKNIKLTHWIDKPKPKAKRRKQKEPEVISKAPVNSEHR